MEDAGRPAEDRRGVAPGLDAVAGRLDDDEPDRRLADEPCEQADRVRAATDTRHRHVRQAPFHGLELRGSLIADPALQVAHDRRVRVRPHRRSEDVVRIADVRHPVAHRLVDGVLERGRAGRDRPDFGTKGAHPQHVRALALDVLGAHVHDTRQVQQGAGRGRGDTVLAGTGLGDDPRLAEAPCEQCLTERVVDLVRSGVGEVLALQVQAEARDDGDVTITWAGHGVGSGRGCGKADGFGPDGLGETVGTVERSRPPGKGREEVAQFGPEDRIVTDSLVGRLELLQGGHECLGDVTPTEVALHPPPAGAVGIDEAGMDGGRSERDRRTVVACDPRPLDEQGHAERVLRRALTRDSRTLSPGRDVHAVRGDGPKSGRHVGRVEAAGQGDRHFPGDGRSQALGRASPGTAGMGPAGRVEEEAFDTAGEIGTTARHEVRGRRREVPWLCRRQVEHLPCPAPDRPGALDRLVPVELDDVRVERFQDRGEQARRRIRRDRHDQGSVSAANGADQPGQGGGLVEGECPGCVGDDVEPDRIGTRGDRGEDAGLIGDAADLDEGPASDVGRIRGRGAGGNERTNRRCWIVAPDECLADEDTIEAEGPPAGDDRRSPDTRLGDDEAIVRDEFAQPAGPLDVHFKRPQVPIVQTDESRGRGKSPVQFTRVVDLDEGLQAQVMRRRDESREPSCGVKDREQEDDVSAGRTKERQLDRVDHEILGQDRDGDRCPNRTKVLDRAAEPMRLAQHGDRRRAPRFVGAGPRDDVFPGHGDPPGRR